MSEDAGIERLFTSVFLFIDGRSSDTGSGLPGSEAADPTAEGAPGLKKKCPPFFQQFARRLLTVIFTLIILPGPATRHRHAHNFRLF